MNFADYFIASLLSSALPILLIGTVALFILREVLTWYWKINKMVDLLEKIEKNTRREGVVQKTENTPISISVK